MSALERETYLVLSTGHLSRETAESVTTLPIVCDQTDARIRIPLVNSEFIDTDALPDDLETVILWARQTAPDIYGLFFDSDGPVIDALPYASW